VQVHVDETATCTAMDDADAHHFTFEYALDKTMAKRG
jgi:hypothetical protein